MARKASNPPFNSYREALHMPAPERGKPFIEYPHKEWPRFKLRVHPPDARGRVLRQWAIRVKYTDALGKEVEDRSTYGQLEAFDKTEVAVDYRDALRQVLARLKEVETLKSSPELAEEASRKAQRMTVADAWARHAVESRTQRPTTVAKEKAQYGRYFTHLADAYLDELSRDFWGDYIHGLSKGKLLSPDGTPKPLAKPLAEATIIGVCNLASKLYTYAQQSEGLGGKPRDWNPALEAKKRLTGTPNKRTHYVRLKHLAEVWRASDALCASWARDQLRCYLLSGLRHALMTGLRFDEVNFEKKRLELSPHKPGTKRRGAKTPENAPTIKLPVSDTFLAIVAARRAYAPDPNGPIWYTVAAPGGKPAKDLKKPVVHSDPRSNWAHVAARVLNGEEFGPHDLRRTYAQTATEAGANLLGASLAMLHSPRTIAKALGLPDVTLDYINTADAQSKVRKAAATVEGYILKLLDGSELPPDEDAERALDEVLATAVDDDA